MSCDDCFFRQRGLCAVSDRQPCATFRPASAGGLRPPRQLHFTFRAERQTRSAWVFPTPQEQAALHA